MRTIFKRGVIPRSRKTMQKRMGRRKERKIVLKNQWRKTETRHETNQKGEQTKRMKDKEDEIWTRTDLNGCCLCMSFLN